MELSEKKLNLIERLMRVKTPDTLAEVEELLIRAEMEMSAKKSVEAIDKNDVVTLGKFAEDNQSWLKKRASKYV